MVSLSGDSLELDVHPHMRTCSHVSSQKKLVLLTSWEVDHLPGWKFYQPKDGFVKVKVKVKADIALHGNPISELRDVTCHMGSHSVTCHPTQVNAPRLTLAMQAGTRFTYPGGMEG